MILCAMICAIPLLWAACTVTRAGYKTPAYTVTQKVKEPVRFEIRDYAEMVLVETPTKPERTGTNATGAKIPMTTPVFFRGTNDTERMSFVMPPEMSVGAVPSPSDKMVQVSERPQGTFAVMPIGTKRARPYLESMVQKLEAALEQTEWKSVGSAEFAYYDPPWIPAWFCRNECLIPVAKKKH